jgi:hypothetical protein
MPFHEDIFPQHLSRKVFFIYFYFHSVWQKVSKQKKGLLKMHRIFFAHTHTHEKVDDIFASFNQKRF